MRLSLPFAEAAFTRFEPCDGVGQGVAGGLRRVAEFAGGFFVGYPHFLFRHADGVQRRTRRAAGELRPRPW